MLAFQSQNKILMIELSRPSFDVNIDHYDRNQFPKFLLFFRFFSDRIRPRGRGTKLIKISKIFQGRQVLKDIQAKPGRKFYTGKLLGFFFLRKTNISPFKGKYLTRHVRYTNKNHPFNLYKQTSIIQYSIFDFLIN